MRYIDEYRDAGRVKAYLELLKQITKHDWTIMEICGGQTHNFVKFGLEELLQERITLVHGPGCPVCVTPIELIDKAIAIASYRNVIFTSFGDMLRVPGSEKDLLTVKSEGGDVRIVYSPLDTIEIAKKNPNKKVVFFAVGFETTAPANAMAVYQAYRSGLKNFSILCAHVLVPPAIEAILSSPKNKIQALLSAGHVCTVMGYEEYIPISYKYKVPIVVTGFEPLDLIQGIYMAVKQLEAGKYTVENQYSRSVRKEGNRNAKELINKVFQKIDRNWRGIGVITNSGYKLSEQFEQFDAEKIFKVNQIQTKESPLCIAGMILQGVKKPFECTAYGNQCTPEHPLGAPMVSSEGACSAYYHYSKKTT